MRVAKIGATAYHPVRVAAQPHRSRHRSRTAWPDLPDLHHPENEAMAAIGRLGQFLGLSIPAAAVLLELNHVITLGQMLVMLVAALCCFWIGRIVEGYAGS